MNINSDDKYLIEKLIKPRIDWNGPIQLAVVVAVLLGANLPFYFMHRADLKEMERSHREWEKKVIILESKQEKKDE